MIALPGLGAMGIHCIMTIRLVLMVLWAGGSGAVGGAEAEISNEVEGAGSFEMELVYRYSDEFRELTKERPGWEHVAWQEWPSKGTAEFYQELVMRDRHRHGGASRNLQSSTADVYSLSPNATTYYIPPMGAIHYTFVSLGTPAKRFLVGLDTGSDLLWVPCDCHQCSTPNWTAYGIQVTGNVFSIYSPSNSSTSKAVACNNEICTATLSPSTCDVATPQSCTYEAKYLSPNTSSSGKIVQDVIYLFQANKSGPQVTSNVYFGCGTTQTGDFLTGGAPDGLFGLGPQAYSVPVTLARSGLTQNVFSLCFIDSYGKLVFGRKPATSLQSTPLIPTTDNVFYELALEGIVAGGASFKAAGRVVFDTGTSLTQLPSNVIKAVGDAIASTTTLKTWTASDSSSSLRLDYCWNATTNAEVDRLSSFSFVFGGGGTWKIINPLLLFGSNEHLEFACLGMVTGDVSIIGYNFMSQYEYFFDLNTSTFSWGPSDCSSSNTLNTIDIAPASAPSPPIQPPSMGPFASPPPTAREPPPGTPQGPPSIGGPAVSKAYRSSRQYTPFQILYLTILSMFFQLIACKMS